MTDQQIKNLTPKEAAHEADGANVFIDNFPKFWEIKTNTFREKEDAKQYKKEMRKEGFYNKQTSYSDFIHICSVRKR